MSRFPSTQWSLIRASGGATAGERQQAFGELARGYRSAILAWFQARLGRQEAEDATQDFLTISFDQAWWSRADEAAGSFRGFLLMLLRRHLGRSRGANRGPLVTDEDAVAGLVDPEISADERFDHRFALVLTARALERLRDDYAGRGRGALIERLLPLLGAPPEHGGLRTLAEELGMPANTLTVELRRLRERLRERLQGELRELCIDQTTFEVEWRSFAAVLGHAF